MKKKARLALMLALAAGSGLAGTASAQYRLNTNDGRLNEANNRLGSNGANQSVQAPQAPNGNLIITGQVTGGQEFRGNVPYLNPMSFHGPTASEMSDNFIRSSTGAPFGGINRDNANVVQPFYGASSTIAPPPGFTALGGGGGFVPAKPITTRAPGDLRLGQVINNPTVSNTLPSPGQLVLPGPVDPTSQTNNVITASPLYGVRQLSPLTNSQDQAMLNSMGTGSLSGLHMDPSTINQIRQQLLQSSGDSSNQQNGQNGNTINGDPNKVGSPGLNSALPLPLESPQTTSLNNSSSLQSNQVLAGQLNANLVTGEGSQQRVLGGQRIQIQSAQYTELQKRLSQYKTMQEGSNTAAARQRDFNEQVRQNQADQAAQAKSATPAGATPNGAPGTPAAATPSAGMPSGVPLPKGVPSLPPSAVKMEPQHSPSEGAPKNPVAMLPPIGSANAAPSLTPPPAPLKIKSLADGVQAKALADMLKDAEDLTRGGKYNSALEQYDMADQVAPNSPLVLLGRANVELGRTYYARAEASLRQAFNQDEALLMGQYDLQSLLGQDRLQTVVADLKAIADREQKEPRPVFLLAYIAYNTGNERRAAAYLDLAEKRAGGKDPLYALIRKHWALPQDSSPISPDELNK